MYHMHKRVRVGQPEGMAGSCNPTNDGTRISFNSLWIFRMSTGMAAKVCQQQILFVCVLHHGNGAGNDVHLPQYCAIHRGKKVWNQIKRSCLHVFRKWNKVGIYHVHVYYMHNIYTFVYTLYCTVYCLIISPDFEVLSLPLFHRNIVTWSGARFNCCRFASENTAYF